MSYFKSHYRHLRYPVAEDGQPGFRAAQLGAIHACAAHFVTRSEPGIVTMPTGSGKTAVLIAAAFALRARRVLVITPSRLVREQIADEVATLQTLKDAEAIGASVPAPKVFGVKGRLSSADQWEELRNYDLVVGTVQSISPEQKGVSEPPRDLFDVVLVDEAHHSPAKTWRALLGHFDSAKCLLFTATPFRRDQKEIKGRFIFTYGLKQAFEDGIFGKITFRPVQPEKGETSDIAIANAAELQVAADRQAGFRHHLMVRTDSRQRAQDLADIYQAHTKLRLKVVMGDKSLKYVKGVIEELNNNGLDGIICVNMLGEGFNFPSLKIAAIHSPHRSLSVTLQFIGRFARTTGLRLGQASFLAVPSEIEIQTEKLYDTQAVWQELVQNLSSARIDSEVHVREVLDTFGEPDEVSQDLSDLSLYSLEPYYHVKVYQLNREVDLLAEVDFPPYLQVVYRNFSEVHNAAVFITRESIQPQWTQDDRLTIQRPDLFMFYQDKNSKLLFICASRRSEGLYIHLSESFKGAAPKPLPLIRLNRALNDIRAPEFFNVGMRNRIAANNSESYRIVSGSSADRSIVKSDARLFHRGHMFGRGKENGELVTIGLSSASKIWSNQSSKLPALIEWCEKLSKKISSKINPSTGSGLDYLDVGEELSELPMGIIAADWPAQVYRNPPSVAFGAIIAQLLDCDISVRQQGKSDPVLVRLEFADLCTFQTLFSLENDRFFEPATTLEPDISVFRDRNSVPLIEFLNEEMLVFFTSDMSLIDGYSILKPPNDTVLHFDDAAIDALDWDAMNVDIRREFGLGNKHKISVHAGLESLLQASPAKVIYYDHGTGEVADYVAVQVDGERTTVRLYHCKGAGGDPGHRVDDIYEVTNQALKSTMWTLKQRLLANIKRRFIHRKGGCRFVKGDLKDLEDIFDNTPAAQIDYEFIMVQPGLSKKGLPPEFGSMLAAASDHLVRGGFKPLVILASK